MVDPYRSERTKRGRYRVNPTKVHVNEYMGRYEPTQLGLVPRHPGLYTPREVTLGGALDGGTRDEVLRQRPVVGEVTEELLGRRGVPLDDRPDARGRELTERHHGGHRVPQRERDRDQLGQLGSLVHRYGGRRAVGRGDDR